MDDWMLLVLKCREGNGEARAELLRKVQAILMKRVARKLGKGEKSYDEDIIQEVLFKIDKRIDTWEGRGQFMAWVFSITNTTIADFYRGFRPVGPIVHDEQVADLGIPKGREAEQIWLGYAKRCKEQILVNDKELADIFESKYIQKKKLSEIKDSTGLSERTIRNYLNRMREQVRRCIELHHEKVS